MVIFIVIMILTLLSPPAFSGAMDDQNDTIGTCFRATELFEKQELAKGINRQNQVLYLRPAKTKTN